MFDKTDYILDLIRNQISSRRKHEKDNLPSDYETAMNLFWDRCMENGILTFNKAKFPDIRWFYGWREWPIVYGDSIMIHHLLNDNYCKENADMIEYVGGEGPYFLEDIIVKRGETMIDAGAYVGDLSAVASSGMGVRVFAFEPSIKVLPILKQTGDLNKFEVIPEGLSDVISKNKLNMSFPGGDFIDREGTQYFSGDEITGITDCVCNTVDNFSEERNLHIDFIKSDIEGFERYMLKGAKKVLQEQEPKLAIRLYHNNHEDKHVIPKLIKEINPRYKLKYGLRGLTVYASTERGI